MDKPRYFDSWKGKVATAIVLHSARTWAEIRDSTGLSPKSFNRVLSEMINSTALEKQKDATYRLEYNLYKTYKEYFESQTESEKRVESIRISEGDQKELRQWLDVWREGVDLKIDARLDHFILTAANLEEFSRKLIAKTRKELIVVNPYVKQTSLSDALRSSKASLKILIARDTDNTFNHNKDELRLYHQSLVDSDINLYYNNRTHGKILISDRTLAVVSSLNFSVTAGGGGSWEAGIVTKREEVIEDIVNEVLNLRDSQDSVKFGIR